MNSSDVDKIKQCFQNFTLDKLNVETPDWCVDDIKPRVPSTPRSSSNLSIDVNDPSYRCDSIQLLQRKDLVGGNIKWKVEPESLNLDSESNSYEEYVEPPSYRQGAIQSIIDEEEKVEKS